MKVWRRHACHAKVHPHAREFPANANTVSAIVSRIPQIIEVISSRSVCGSELMLQRSDPTLRFSDVRFHSTFASAFKINRAQPSLLRALVRRSSHKNQNTYGIIRFVAFEYSRYSGYVRLTKRSSQTIRTSPPRNNSAPNAALTRDQWATMPTQPKRHAAV